MTDLSAVHTKRLILNRNVCQHHLIKPLFDDGSVEDWTPVQLRGSSVQNLEKLFKKVFASHYLKWMRASHFRLVRTPLTHNFGLHTQNLWSRIKSHWLTYFTNSDNT